MTTPSQKDLVDSVYNVALQPDRYLELALIWKERFSEILNIPDERMLEFADDVQRGLQILQTVTSHEKEHTLRLSGFELSLIHI